MVSVIYSFSVIGFHSWPDAPDRFSYLSERHRHVFEVTCKAPVSHGDREIEINEARERAESFLHSKFGDPCEFCGMSCEQIAELLADTFELCSCEVLEDGYCGAEVVRC